MIKHGQRCPVCKLYWNDNTKKWLKKPPRESSKGSHKGKSYLHQLNQIQGSASKWKSYAWLPINLTVEQILSDAEKLWDDKSDFCLDRALSLSSLLIITRTKDSEKHKFGYKNGYINVYADDMRKWVYSRYEVYLRFFEKAEYIMPYLKGKKGYMASNQVQQGYSKQYKFNPLLLVKQGDKRKYHRTEYTTPRLLVKLHKHKVSKQNLIKNLQVRSIMVDNVYKMIEALDFEAFEKWCLDNPSEFSSPDIMNDMVVIVSEIKEGKIYINPKDGYGFRFHSPFTNLKKVIRKFIMIDGAPASELDIRNSQFFFLACLTLYPEACTDILKSSVNTRELRTILHTLRFFYYTYPDFKDFIDASLEGTVYDSLVDRLNLTGKNYKVRRNKAKDLCFGALFSKKEQCENLKSLLVWEFPNLIRVCEIINGGEYPLPMLLQRIESHMIVDTVAVTAADNVDGIYTTVHDSVLCGASDLPIFKALIKDAFDTAGLPQPMVSIKNNGSQVEHEIVTEQKATATAELPDTTPLDKLQQRFEAQLATDSL
ncbi:hypothetical protein I0P70_07120 [Pontibacter sp. FD36]|uniref:hypothetical protein n=1 Tax=Pontibacter sp. FD36 TaxID=2789860 RepID=UPI0018AC8B25|nr:hypothetical protein [Pontibacter sp. FD36]MBF8963009.1 hypothetical protein [Pontibacter sp. FD36]